MIEFLDTAGPMFVIRIVRYTPMPAPDVPIFAGGSFAHMEVLTKAYKFQAIESVEAQYGFWPSAADAIKALVAWEGEVRT